MKKGLKTILITLLALAALTSCSKKAETATTAAAADKAASTGVSIVFLNSKGEVQIGLEEMAKAYEAETGNHVEVIRTGAGEVPYTKITTMYNSGNAPALAMLDTTDVVALASEYALDLSNEKWVADTQAMITKVDGKVYSFPFCIEGRGLIYNKAAIEKVLGTTFDPSTIKTTEDFSELLASLRAKGMEYPVFVAMEDWSLGAHQLGFVYDAYDGTTAGSAKTIDEFKAGKDPLTDDRFNQFVDTFDLLKEYNYAHQDPLGADYEEGALLLAEGEVAFWSNGCWAWPNLVEGGATTDQEFGFLPFFLGNDTSDFANTSIQASASKQVMIDRVQNSAEQQAVAKDFLNWIVYSTTGQKMIVEDCAIIPAATNNPNQPADPLGKDIVARIADGTVYTSCFIAPSDHWSVMGAAMQKYLAGQSDKNELAASLSDYWKKQN